MLAVAAGGARPSPSRHSRPFSSSFVLAHFPSALPPSACARPPVHHVQTGHAQTDNNNMNEVVRLSDKLLSPYRLGTLTLPNRAVMAPLTRNRAGAGNVPSDL